MIRLELVSVVASFSHIIFTKTDKTRYGKSRSEILLSSRLGLETYPMEYGVWSMEDNYAVSQSHDGKKPSTHLDRPSSSYGPVHIVFLYICLNGTYLNLTKPRELRAEGAEGS